MAFYLGVDIGTTKIAALVLDAETGRVVALHETSVDAETTSAADKARGRSEWDAERAAAHAFECIARTLAQAGGVPIAAVGVAGQMHGMALLSAEGKPVSPFIGWQDQRCQDPVPGRDFNYIGWMMQLAGLGGYARTGCPPATGYMGSTLFWLAANGDERVVKSSGCCSGLRACFMADYVVIRLTGEPAMTDPTNAAGSGLFDVAAGRWNRPLIERLGLCMDVFPPVMKSGSVAGVVTPEAAAATGLKAGTPVCVACGDNQASFAGSVANPGEMAMINIGTGAQVSAWAPFMITVPSVDTRPHLDGGYLLVGAPLCGGYSYQLLRDFFRKVGQAFFNVPAEQDPYDEMNRLARAVPAGADGLKCEPLFTGTRLDPARRAAWSGISPANFTPGHFARSALEGVAEQLRLYYADMLENGVKPRKTLIASGNGVRRNALFGEILADAFKMPLRLPASTEESASGAAILASVGAGEFPNLQAAAAKLVQYR
jgi:sugar (pentulose or hexulose) kinase